jgi:hypothetical protein
MTKTEFDKMADMTSEPSPLARLYNMESELAQIVQLFKDNKVLANPLQEVTKALSKVCRTAHPCFGCGTETCKLATPAPLFTPVVDGVQKSVCPYKTL